jgi:hypothetical protein
VKTSPGAPSRGHRQASPSPAAAPKEQPKDRSDHDDPQQWVYDNAKYGGDGNDNYGDEDVE